MLKISLFILLFCQLFSLAQNVVVVHESGYKHEYVIGRLTNLENLKDTTRHKYVATISVRCIAHPGIIISNLGAVKMKMKALGANGYFLSSFTRNDSIIDLCFRSYFINDNYFKINESYRVKNKIILFSHMAQPGTLQLFHVNDSCIHFNSSKYYSYDVAVKTPYKFYACDEFQLGSTLGPTMVLVGSMKIKYKKQGEATFIGIFSNALIPKEKMDPKRNYPGLKCGLQPIDYEDGRVLMEIMKADN
jgi:hypothetical protein